MTKMDIAESEWNNLIIFYLIGLGTTLSITLIFLRIYLRTKLIGYLLYTIGCGASLILLIIMVVFESVYLSAAIKIVVYLSLTIVFIGIAILGTIESGKLKEAFKNRSYFQRMIGSISPDYKKRKYKPSVKRYEGLIGGILVIAIGGLLEAIDKFFNLHNKGFFSFSFYSLLCIFTGIIVIFFSLFLPKDEK